MGARGMGFAALSSTARRGISDNVSPVHEAVIPRTQTSQHTRDTAPCRGAPAVAVAFARGERQARERFKRRATTLMDYALPRSDDIPAMVIDHLEVPIAPRVLIRL